MMIKKKIKTDCNPCLTLFSFSLQAFYLVKIGYITATEDGVEVRHFSTVLPNYNHFLEIIKLQLIIKEQQNIFHS